MINIPNEFHAIEEGGFARYRITREHLGPQTAMLEAISDQIPRIAPRILPGISMSLSRKHVGLVQELTEIKLRTFFRPQTDVNEQVTIVPVFVTPGAEMTLTWPVPRDMKVFFLGLWDIGGERDLFDRVPACYMIARDNEKKTRLLPLPNLHADGRICMGEAQRSWVKADIFKTFQGMIEVFNTAPWNMDLLHERRGNSQALFRFTPEGAPVAPTRAWTELSPIVNNTHYQFLATI